jgi:hypothetical protein
MKGSIDNLPLLSSEAMALLTQGKFDKLLLDPSFFNDTEELILSLISTRQMAITEQKIYKARLEIIQAAQAFYFYAVKRLNYKIHPRIEKVMKKT